MSSPLLQLRFENNETDHGDLIFYFGDHRLVEDSYYLRIDPTDTKDESHANTASVLVRLLEQWLVCVENAPAGEVRFLPYGFSDQSISWLRCAFDNGVVELQPGYSEKEGWSVTPSKILDHVENVDGFVALEDVAPITCARGLLELELTVSIGDARNGIADGRYSSQIESQPTGVEQTLDQLQIGEKGVVTGVSGSADEIELARNSGLTNGAEIVLLSFSDAGETIEFEIANKQHSLARKSACNVSISRVT